jgi:chromosome segregation ATPase
MARGGIYKSEVVRARGKLLAQGITPTIDVIRAELGNTGSKTTIHRYLKEIEEEESAIGGKKVSVSDTIQNMVDTLAARLHEEAEAKITEAAEKNKVILAQKDAELASKVQEIESLNGELKSIQTTLAEEAARLKETTASLRAEALERARLQQQVTDLQERLAEEAALRKSLDEKHQQARDALEHFRQAAKEQREHEQRQHEQQVQYLQSEVKNLNQNMSKKMQEIMSANKENGRLTSELSRVEGALHEIRAKLAQAKTIKTDLEAAKNNEANLERRVVEQQSALEESKTSIKLLEQERLKQADGIRQLEIELAIAKSASEAQEGLIDQFKLLVEKISSAQSSSKASTSRRLKPA